MVYQQYRDVALRHVCVCVCVFMCVCVCVHVCVCVLWLQESTALNNIYGSIAHQLIMYLISK